MIKTSINRHDLEYFVYAMARAFYKDTDVLAPDTAFHNMKEDSVGSHEDCIDFCIECDKLKVALTKGQVFEEDREFVYDIDTVKTLVNDASKESMSDKDILALIENDGEIKDRYKDELRGYVYDTFVKASGRELPWGNLTGIRPTKLYLQKLIQNAGDKGISIDSNENISFAMSEMERIYRVSSDKNRLGAEIALREKSVVNSVDRVNGYSLYIGIPFCPSTCLYCSFTSNPIFSYKSKVSDYLYAVRRELEAVSEIMQGKTLDTIYIGGGTPTTLEASELEILLEDITRLFPADSVSEFTVEAGRADSITKEKLQVLKKYPVTRISINPQTMNDKTLKLIGRHHSTADVKQAFELARNLGFDNINADIILGLPEESLEDVKFTLEEIVKLRPESLTVHSLAVKRASKMKEYMESHNISCYMDLDAAMKLATGVSKSMGLEPYYMYRQKDMAGNLENTGFAKPDKYGIYNILMIEEVQSIVACGAGTVSKRVFADGHIERCDTSKDVNHYIENIEEMIERKRRLYEEEN